MNTKEHSQEERVSQESEKQKEVKNMYCSNSKLITRLNVGIVGFLQSTDMLKV